MQLILEVLVHHVDHPITNAPQQEQRADERKREHIVLAVFGLKHLRHIHSDFP